MEEADAVDCAAAMRVRIIAQHGHVEKVSAGHDRGPSPEPRQGGGHVRARPGIVTDRGPPDDVPVGVEIHQVQLAAEVGDRRREL
ncbi:hypothetical protein [Kutzneria sp. CA-103260]|uniref:hypothetical protein n=1 Tax=Kutzneria sp. CA-103260 TaxID=2802641 RepID=UPI001BAAC68F|nr:hypothetical protein [Kutzneria sp. CA-103260]